MATETHELAGACVNLAAEIRKEIVKRCPNEKNLAIYVTPNDILAAATLLAGSGRVVERDFWGLNEGGQPEMSAADRVRMMQGIQANPYPKGEDEKAAAKVRNAQAKRILIDTRDKLSDGCWTQNFGAKNEFGERVSSEDPKAVKWGLLDALNLMAMGDDEDGEAPGRLEAHEAVERACGLGKGGGLIEWNDKKGRTFDEVLAVLDAAIAELDAAIKRDE